MYNYRTVSAYFAQCRWRRKIPTWAGLAAFATPLKLTTRRIIQPEPIEMRKEERPWNRSCG